MEGEEPCGSRGVKMTLICSLVFGSYYAVFQGKVLPSGEVDYEALLRRDAT